MSSIAIYQVTSKEPVLSSTYLPRLLYVGDVTVEATVSGSVLLYRLLQKYPVSQLRIAEGSIRKSRIANRLPDVRYDVFHSGSYRFLHTRFAYYYSAYLFYTARLRLKEVLSIARDFRPEAILTVTHGFSWITAWQLASHLNLPLHLVCHDDWTAANTLPRSMKSISRQTFERVYRFAQSRLCASPYMAEEYKRQFHVNGRVLYPLLAADVPKIKHPPNYEEPLQRPLTFAYAGSINSDGYAALITLLATILAKHNYQLIVYSALTNDAIKRYGFDRENITIRQLVPSNKLICALRKEADVLFVPMDFGAAHKGNMQAGFPSKLTDYTAIGLPLLICGPPYCSAVRWAQENSGAGEVVAEFNMEAMASAVSKLENAAYRFSLASKALAKGQEFFSHSQVVKLFYDALTDMRG